MSQLDPCGDFQCPIQFVVDLLGNKWSILVLKELFGGDSHGDSFPKRRTHELLKALPGISTKTLTMRLRELEEQGLIKREIYPEIPPRVEYSLTPKGYQIQPVMAALHQVGSKWLEQEPCVCPLQEIQPFEPIVAGKGNGRVADENTPNNSPPSDDKFDPITETREWSAAATD
ncbi:hypothetical protein C7B64_21630 [Merismopedia glauca CCAP 1448/3]|uniref:HTH hxlR-type domain-containing protein n=1 Tax=Merismopedia glauca CCAP 1448/3 TaxID=1296344 RepID=A0A2T1BXQ3_9CYAN|nr:hypothetical protein C7B64_21630 [Merismopedia glauca CCAP 1448/3]